MRRQQGPWEPVPPILLFLELGELPLRSGPESSSCQVRQSSTLSAQTFSLPLQFLRHASKLQETTAHLTLSTLSLFSIDFTANHSNNRMTSGVIIINDERWMSNGSSCDPRLLARGIEGAVPRDFCAASQSSSKQWAMKSS
jgi:hypothetical protein